MTTNESINQNIECHIGNSLISYIYMEEYRFSDDPCVEILHVKQELYIDNEITDIKRNYCNKIKYKRITKNKRKSKKSI